MEIVGWLFHETQPIQRAFASTDLLTFQPLQTGGEFAGVKARFPDLPNAGNCRLAGLVDVSSKLPAPACVRVYAELSDGSMHLCMAVHCRPVTTEEIKKTCPSFSLWKFWQSWRELKQIVQRGMSLETGAPLRREFWSTLRRCRQMTAPRGTLALSISPSKSQASNQKLRLLLITHNLNFEGAPLLFVEYARHLVEKSGAEISVLTSQEGPLRTAFESLGASVTVVESSARSPAELSQQLGKISRPLDWKKIDLVVANTVACFWGVTLANSTSRPSLLYIHESTSPATFFRRTTPALLPAVYDAFRRATAVSFNTPATQVYYATLGSGKNFHLNSAWIDLTALEAFRIAHPREALRAGLGLRPDELLVANIGTVCERKGQHDFLRAVEWLWRRAPALAARCRFVMVGGRNTRYNQSLEKDLTAMDRKNIRIIPETSRAFDYFGAADLFVCTSYEESFPRVVLEAMTFGVPIVSTDVHGIPYMLRSEREAILVAPGDIDALTSGMLRLLENSSEARAFAAHAQARVKEFAAETILPRHAAFTTEVAAQPA
jgi:glycosyltransferase involved in cell wall biosynthesis